MIYLNNDVLSIISIYAGFELKYNKNKLVIDVNNRCESCNERMRRTNKSLVEAFTFPKLWEIDRDFLQTDSKYIRPENTFIYFNKHLYTYEEAYNIGIISYDPTFHRGYPFTNYDNQIYGACLNTNGNYIKIFVKKAPSLCLLYKALRENLHLTNNEDMFLRKLQEFGKEGIDDNIISRSINQINIINKPIKIVVKLCSKCRKKLKKGYIFT
jgi:uncharacterized protein with PIN domain